MKELFNREPFALAAFSLVILLMPIWLRPFGADYPDLAPALREPGPTLLPECIVVKPVTDSLGA